MHDVAQLEQRTRGRSHEGTFDKHTFDGFYRTPTKSFLRRRRVDSVFVVGVETHACVLSTSLSAAMGGFRTTIIKDCVHAARSSLHAPALKIFRDAFGTTESLANVFPGVVQPRA